MWSGRCTSINDLLREFHAIVLCRRIDHSIGTWAQFPGQDLKGVHFAMDFLKQQNKRAKAFDFAEEDILAAHKRVIMIRGGDTKAVTA